MSATATTAGLERELLDLPRRVQEAAAEGDAEAWAALRMSLNALPEFIRRRHAEPIREAIERLENEREGLLEDERRVREGEPPEVPGHLRGYQTPSQMRQARITEIVRAGIQVGAELKAKKTELRQILDGK